MRFCVSAGVRGEGVTKENKERGKEESRSILGATRKKSRYLKEAERDRTVGSCRVSAFLPVDVLVETGQNGMCQNRVQSK